MLESVDVRFRFYFKKVHEQVSTTFKHFPVVDLFAGPGGLGEGFATLTNENGKKTFKSVASIERDDFAYQTLHLRHFLRAFPRGEFPSEYYSYLEGKISKTSLYEKFPIQKNHADQTALKISLGDDEEYGEY